MTAAHPTSKHTQPASCVGAWSRGRGRAQRGRARTNTVVRRQPRDVEDAQGYGDGGGAIIGAERVIAGQAVVVDPEMQHPLDPCRRGSNPDVHIRGHLRHGEADAPCPRRYSGSPPARAPTTRAVHGDDKIEHVLRIVGAEQDSRVVGDHIIDALREDPQGDRCRCRPGRGYFPTTLRRDGRAPEHGAHKHRNRGTDKGASLHGAVTSSLPTRARLHLGTSGRGRSHLAHLAVPGRPPPWHCIVPGEGNVLPSRQDVRELPDLGVAEVRDVELTVPPVEREPLGDTERCRERTSLDAVSCRATSTHPRDCVEGAITTLDPAGRHPPDPGSPARWPAGASSTPAQW